MTVTSVGPCVGGGGRAGVCVVFRGMDAAVFCPVHPMPRCVPTPRPVGTHRGTRIGAGKKRDRRMRALVQVGYRSQLLRSPALLGVRPANATVETSIGPALSLHLLNLLLFGGGWVALLFLFSRPIGPGMRTMAPKNRTAKYPATLRRAEQAAEAR